MKNPDTKNAIELAIFLVSGLEVREPQGGEEGKSKHEKCGHPQLVIES